MTRRIRIEGDVAYVPLTKGYEAVIDAIDVPLVESWCWCAQVCPRAVYAIRSDHRPNRRTIRMHRVLMGEIHGLEVDHRDGDGLNNRRKNLRVATRTQNIRNQRLRSDNTSGIKGVHWFKASRKWRACICLNGKNRHLGSFDSREEAHDAYRTASKEMHGEFGRLA